MKRPTPLALALAPATPPDDSREPRPALAEAAGLQGGFEIVPIGVVRSAVTCCDDVPVDGAEAVLEIHERFAAGLLEIELSSHLIVVGLLHRADRGALQARAKKCGSGERPRGVFGTRSPARPNPLSVTVVPLLGRDGRRLRVDHLDLLDGTPIVDLKSYSPGWDSVFCATRERRTPARDLEPARLAALLRRGLENHLGEQEACLSEARLGLAAAFLAARHFTADLRDPALSATINRCDGATDALLGLMGASFSNGRLRLTGEEGPLTVRFEIERRSLELRARPGAALPEPFEDWGSAFDAKAGG